MKICKKCILSDSMPGITFNEQDVCNYCTTNHRSTENNKEEFTEERLKLYLAKYREVNSKYDVLVPISGGVDSSVALINLVEKYNLRPLAFHNDHGYEDQTATDNVKKLCKALDVDLIIWQHDFTFMKKLWKYINESKIEGLSTCYLCGNILYMNALELAATFNIPLIINGYSKGQVDLINNKDKANRLLEDIINYLVNKGDREFLNEFIKKYDILSKQKVLSHIEDFEAEPDFSKINFIPYYLFEFNKMDKEILKEFCINKFEWKQMKQTYPSRTTNCEMIWLNSYFDLKKKNYTVYTEEYASLIRKGEITREQALRDLEFNPPEGLLEKLSKGIDIDLDFEYIQEIKEDEIEEIMDEKDFEF